jgi:SAM-dependent methyltransferase
MALRDLTRRTDARDEGPVDCVLCGRSTLRRLGFFEAFPHRAGSRAGFRRSEDPPPVPSWRMTVCQACGGVQPLPYPPVADIVDYYASSDAADEWEVEHYVRLDLNPKAIEQTQHLADQFTRQLGRPGRLLEVGCASGWVLKAARDQGWEVLGIEAAPKFARFARDELGLDIFEGPLAEVDTASVGPFDLLVGFDVFEHLHDPAGDLRTLRQLAGDGATLLLTTPWFSSPCARLYGVNWRQILPSHITLSTRESMERVLARTGWRLERLSEPRYWDPDDSTERRNRWREQAKFLARLLLVNTIVKPSERVPALRKLPPLLTRGRLSWKDFVYRVGDQPVLGDVMFVIARAS